MEVTPAGFAAMAATCAEIAAESAGGRLAAVLEGGYALDAIVDGVDSMLGALRGARPPALPMPGVARRVEPVLDRVRAVHGRYWRL
jgi:acetoin utilization deacetylase AcuC-like enzyme